MMMKSMNLCVRRELQSIIKQKYRNACWADKRKYWMDLLLPQVTSGNIPFSC